LLSLHFSELYLSCLSLKRQVGFVLPAHG